MDDEIKESRQATNPQERLRLIKEQRKKQHEERLEKSSLFSGDGLGDESSTLKRFSKYRRSGREGSQKEDSSSCSHLSTVEQNLGASILKDSDGSCLSGLSEKHHWNTSPLFSSASPAPEHKITEVQIHDVLPTNASTYKSPTATAASEFRLHLSGATLTTSLSLDQNKGVLKKPTIPPILRSATEPTAASSSSNDDDSVTHKKPSILKKKDETSSSGTSSCSSGSGQPASVSFGLPTSKTVLTRTKSIDSNLSGDSETGYWSGGENYGGILKNRRLTVDGDQLDQSSILKLRRSSLGSSAMSTSSEGGLQSILKRKLSYDSSYIMKESNANEYSFSTHSLPACGWLSPEPKPILKKKSSSEDLEEIEPKPILKYRSSRDYPDFSADSERIKSCLKKSSSKSVDEGFDSTFPSSSVNYSTSYSSSVTPINGSFDGAANNANKGILKRSGILKHPWRESSSTSTFSTSSDAENSRPFQFLDREGDLYETSFSKDSTSDLHRARRFFCSESDINTNEQTEHILPPKACAKSLPSYRETRSDATAVENGLASHDFGEPRHPPSESVKSKNNNNTTTATIFDSIQGKTSCDDNQSVLTDFGAQKKYSFTKNYISCDDKSGDREISDSPFRFNLRQTFIDNNNPPPLHDLCSVSTAEERVLGETPKGTNFLNSLCGGRSECNQKAEVVTATNAMASIRTDSHEDIIMSLSVAEKRSLFMQLEDEKAQEALGLRKRGASRSGRPKRYTTQPITTEEVEKASKMMVQNKECESVGSTEAASTKVKNGTLYESDHVNRTIDDLVASSLGTTVFQENINSRSHDRPLISHKSMDSGITSNVNDQLSWEGDENSFNRPGVHDRLFASASKSELEDAKPPIPSPLISKPPSGGEATSGLPTHTVDGISSSKPKKTRIMTGSTIEDKKSTVRDEEGYNENESEWSETSQSLDDISEGSNSSAPCKNKLNEDFNSFQELASETLINKARLKSCSKMPEKVLTLSDDLSSSSNDEANSDFVKEEFHCGDSTCLSDPFSCVKRKLSKSSSANSMMMSPESDVNLFQKGKMNRTSIADKIAALQTNSDIGWKKRVTKVNPDKEKIIPTDQNDNVEFKRNNKEFKGIASRLNQLESSQESWKKRVGENDANIFTVQGRLEKAGKIVKNATEGPTIPPPDNKVKGIKMLSPLRFRNKASEGSDENSNSPTSEDSQENNDAPKTPPKVILDISPKRHRQLSRSGTTSSESLEEEKVTRAISRNDNETFSVFFAPMLQSEILSCKQTKSSTATRSVQIEDSSFNAIQVERRQLLGMRRNVKAPRNHTCAKNPVKSLALRIQEQSYVELSPQVREKEMKKRAQIENLAKNAHLSVEALAGLASKEDFTAVKLKKAGDELTKKEYPHPMLIRIKGKRQVQTRLVPPEVKSISSGDNYILVTANKLYQFVGEYSNRLERAKIADVVSHIAQKKDLGCRISSVAEVVTLEEPLLSLGRDRQQFFELLGGGNMPEANDLGDELDEAYESGIVTTNRVFEINGIKEELVPLLEAGGWGCQPRHSLLQDDKVLVFDFGSEIYVWSGSKADPSLKKSGYREAKRLFEGAYSYADVEPLCCPLVNSLEGSHRPTWSFVKKINQHMEPILFIEKFFDWPDDSGRLIKVQQKRTSDSSQKEASYNFKACSVEEMLASAASIPDPGLELEGFDVGRGSEVHNSEDRRTFTITNLDVKAWNISEFSKSEVEESSLGQFYSEETYVIRWQFSVTQIGRDLKGNKSRHSGVLGRERCTYFFWQGKHSKITEQGTSALMTVELDQEKGPQVRVEQGREPPAFLSRFNGLMFVHLGCKEAPLKDSKLYVAMGACESEGHFIEVQCEAGSFRSLGSFILVDFVKGRIYLWHGSLSNSTTRKIASHGVKQIIDAPDRYLNFHGAFRLIEFEEGSENQAFLTCLDVSSKTKWNSSYVSLTGLNQLDYADVSVFAFSSLQGSFEANAVVSVKRKSGSPEAFPVLQEEFYSAQQPRLFLVSRGPETWLWQGWTPLGDEDNENMATGSGEIRLAAEKKAALETALHFAKLKGTVGYLVLAGLEPVRFTNMFPYWSVLDEAREVNMTEGRSPGLAIPLEEAMQTFLKASYTLEELQERPDGVDQSKLETYLSDEEFETVLKMGREEFNRLQSWKQTELKKAVGLF